MKTIDVPHDSARPFVTHGRGEASPVVQVSSERAAVEVALAKAAQRSVCVHQLYRFRNQVRPEAICERDDLRFVAI